jgi:hypothetical protein
LGVAFEFGLWVRFLFRKADCGIPLAEGVMVAAKIVSVGIINNLEGDQNEHYYDSLRQRDALK